LIVITIIKKIATAIDLYFEICKDDYILIYQCIDWKTIQIV